MGIHANLILGFQGRGIGNPKVLELLTRIGNTLAILLTERIAAPDIRYHWEWQLGRLFKQ